MLFNAHITLAVLGWLHPDVEVSDKVLYCVEERILRAKTVPTVKLLKKTIECGYFWYCISSRTNEECYFGVFIPVK